MIGPTILSIILCFGPQYSSAAWVPPTRGVLPTTTLGRVGREKPSCISSTTALCLSNKRVDLDQLAWVMPPLLGTTAFASYPHTSRAFQQLLLTVSGANTAASTTIDDTSNSVIQAILSGPVTLSVSILFGTLVAMTIQTLYDRQKNIHQQLISQIEQVHDTQLLLQSFPQPYQAKGMRLLQAFSTNSLQQLENGNLTATSIRDRREISLLLLLLNDLSSPAKTPSTTETPNTLSEVYNAVTRFQDIRVNLITALQTQFSPAHYANMIVLAATLLLVFLLQTVDVAVVMDSTSTATVSSSVTTATSAADFQLSLCWALLIGTYTLLGVVIYDLSTPWSGIFQTTPLLDLEDVELYALMIAEEQDDNS